MLPRGLAGRGAPRTVVRSTIGKLEGRKVLRGSAYIRPGLGLFMAFACAALPAQFVPPAGYSGKPGPPLGPAQPGAPELRLISTSEVISLAALNANYQQPASVQVIGAYEIAEAENRRFVSAWASGFLPVTLQFNDGGCFSLIADYEGGTLSNARLKEASCEHQERFKGGAVPPSPDPALQVVGSAGDYWAWSDKQAGVTVVTGPLLNGTRPFFTVRIAAETILAMRAIDAPLGNVTLVGRIDGRLSVVTLFTHH